LMCHIFPKDSPVHVALLQEKKSMQLANTSGYPACWQSDSR